MSNKSIRINLKMDGKENKKVEVNGSLRGKGLNMHMGRKIWNHKRDLMQLGKVMGLNNNNNIEVRALVSWSVGHVLKKTLGDIFHNIRVEGLRYTMHRRCKLLGMLEKIFHVSMQ